MPPPFAPPPVCESAPPSPWQHELLAERFAASAAAGNTIALVIANDPEAAVVYYFRDAARALSTYERLARLSSRPAVAYISPGGAVLGPPPVVEASMLGRCAAGWFATALRGDPHPLRHVAPAL